MNTRFLLVRTASITFLFIILAAYNSSAQFLYDPNNWLLQHGGIGHEYFQAICTDPTDSHVFVGSKHTVGGYVNHILPNRKRATASLLDHNQHEIYIVKYDIDGQKKKNHFLFARAGLFTDLNHMVSTSDGDLIYGGHFADSLWFDQLGAIVSQGSSSGFIARTDDRGELKWITTFSSTGAPIAPKSSCAEVVQVRKDIAFTGFAHDQLDYVVYDDQLNVVWTGSTNSVNSGAILGRLNGVTGKPLWTRIVPDGIGRGITVNPNTSEIVACGKLDATSPLATGPNEDGFIVCYSYGGIQKFIKEVGTAEGSCADVTHVRGSQYCVVGNFQQPINNKILGLPGITTFYNLLHNEVFCIYFNQSGDFTRIHGIGGPNSDIWATKVDALPSGHIAITGILEGGHVYDYGLPYYAPAGASITPPDNIKRPFLYTSEGPLINGKLQILNVDASSNANSYHVVMATETSSNGTKYPVSFCQGDFTGTLSMIASPFIYYSGSWHWREKEIISDNSDMFWWKYHDRLNPISTPKTDFSNAGVDLERLPTSIYPNPLSGNLLSVNGIMSKTDLQVFDLNGRSVYRTRLSSIENSVELPNITPGTYLIELIQEDGQREQHKLVVN